MTSSRLPALPVVLLLALLLAAAGGLSAPALAAPPAAPLAAPPITPGHGALVRTAPRATVDDPLLVTLAGVSPAVVPDRGPVVLRGTVTNVSDDTWTAVNVYPFVSPTPITSAADLQDAAATDPDEVPGGRVVEVDRPATLDTLDRLDPGESASFSVRIPQDVLARYLAPGDPGVYWFGVQALGADTAGRDTLADGRAFTFLPKTARRSATASARVAVVVPIRRSVGYNRDGSLRGLAGWARDLASGGRLSNLLALGTTAPPGRLTWLVDPAVLDAVTRLSRGDPTRTLTTDDGTTGPSASPSGDPSDGSAATGTADTSAVSRELRTQAAAWLAGLTPVLRRDSVLALPYGDLDVAAASLRDPSMLQRATRLSASYFSALGIGAQPTVSASSGWVKPASVAVLDPDTTVLMADTAAAAGLPGGRVRPVQVEVGSRTVDLYDAAASTGGTGPTDATSPLGLRQRLLAEAALRSRRSDPPGLVVSLPADWNPGTDVGRLFAGLRRPWLDLVPQPAMTATDPPTVALDDLVYPVREAAAELPSTTFAAAEGLRRAGQTLQDLLVGPSTVGEQVTAQALTGLAYGDRDRPGVPAGRARSATDRIRAQLRQVTIATPDFVTLASASGNRFRVDVSNGLPAAVRVRIDPVVDAGLRISTPRVLTIEGGAKASPLLTARSNRLGFHQVDLELTTTEGTRLGSGSELPIRSSRTGRIIWVIIAGGAALLFGAIAMRLLRRYRRHRAGRPTAAGAP